ncbi:TetR family transcriptional regulator [Leptospira kobayashii]|uniref:TetR family transcriptional regulator n=1 Tax=Leptospira kobayashii TaxID=1917830 RepID=A0ABN6KCE5_9LEPT|nr:TetR/AcrR family transcriptional regulator [Leptospira kobayashii]BDA78295.1 TetR family transcriptional regulator [Leptospira kobayashii]
MPKIVDHEKYREELWKGAFPIFIEKGYLPVTMRELAQVLNVSTGTLYHYFETKEILFETMVRFVIGEDLSQLEERWKLKGENVSENSEILIEYLESKSSHFQSLLVLALDIHRNSDLKLKFSSLLNESFLQFQRILESRFESKGEFLLSYIIGELYKNLIIGHPIRWGHNLKEVLKSFQFSII